jgi:hypothetical protein
MDTRPDGLSDFERRLAALAPREDGLSPDAMLYAAGVAAAGARANRFIWPVVATVLAVVAIGLGHQLLVERDARQALAAELLAAKKTQTIVAPAVPVEPTAIEDRKTDTLLSSRRLLIDGLDDPRSAAAGLTPSVPAVDEATLLHAWPLRGSPDL